MALLYDAELSPGKLEAIAAWLPGQAWSGVATGAEVERVTSYRFDDPAGEVGIEIHLVRVPGTEEILQVPVTYRGEPLENAGPHLITEMDHSVLGTRWVYDGAADPVFLGELERAIRTGGTNAREFMSTDDGEVERTDIASVRGINDRDGSDDLSAEAAHPLAETLSFDPNPSPTTLAGTTMVRAGDADLEILRFPSAMDADAPSGTVLGRLVGTWEGQDAPVLLARLVDH